MSEYYLGIDQGTSGTTVLLVDEKWNVVVQHSVAHTQIYPNPGWVEHNPLEIWGAIQEACAAVLRKSGVRAGEVAAIGLDHQGETCAVWDKTTGQPVYNAIVWQDRRTAAEIDSLKETYGAAIHQKTGLTPDACFSATKLKWILDNVEGVRERAEKGELMAGTLDSFILWKFTGGQTFATDASTASRTMLMDLEKGEWDPQLLDLFNIPRNILPPILDSSHIYGYTTLEVFHGASVPIGACITDALAATFAQACLKPGDLKASYGTGVFMCFNIGDQVKYSSNGLLTCCLWSLNGRRSYEFDAGVFIAGAAIQWLRDKLQIIQTASETEQMALSVPDTHGVYFVPAFAGLAAPHWDQYARGMIIGLTGGARKEHIVRAADESIAFQVYDNVEAMKKDSGIDIPRLRVDGGPVADSFLMQFQADILGIPVDVPQVSEMSAYGAAQLAAMALGRLDEETVTRNWRLKKSYHPQMTTTERESRMEEWNRAVERCKDWACPL